MSDPIIHRGAGILFITPKGKALFVKRGPGGDAPGAWGFPGGRMEAGETGEQCARREALEELGDHPRGTLGLHCRVIMPRSVINGLPASPDDAGDKVDFTTYMQRVDEEFAPKLNGEHTGWAWASVTEPLIPLHPGSQIALDRLTWDELGVARAMASGLLTSPQLYGNVHLFDMRITGTGVAYRGPKYDDNDKEISPEEFVYRRPENYLTDEFLQRCGGLSVIMMHPAKALLTSKEFGARVVGAVMLPYIKGDEVWGVCKIYDDDAVKMLTSSQMSTSPAVLLGNGDQKLKTEDGTDLLIEGKPSLLDHLAICERGVWDKGGDPSGVRTDNQQSEDTDMTKEQMEALNKQIADAVAAAVPGIITSVTAAVRADDSGGQKLDKVLSAIDAFCGKMDAFEKRMDEHGKKMDADDRKDSDKTEITRKDCESEEDFKKRSDEAAVAADKARKDAEEKEVKEKADAEAKEKADAEEEEKKKADAAAAAGRSSDFDRLVGATTDMAKRMKALEANMPRQLTDDDRHAFSAAQARADEVFSAFGKRAPYPLSGEEVLPYRRRLVASLKEHSPAWKDVDVLAIADAATFKIAEDTILREAAKAALHPADLRVGELREIVRVDAASGVRVVEFRGNHSFVKGLTRAPRHVRTIGVRKEA